MEDLTKNKIGNETLNANVNNNSGKHVFKLLLAGMFLWLSISSFHHFFTMLFEDLCFLLGIRVVLIYLIVEIGSIVVILFLLFLALKKIERISYKLDKAMGNLIAYLVVAYVVSQVAQFFYVGYVQIYLHVNKLDILIAYYSLSESTLYYTLFEVGFFTILLALSSIMIYRKKENFNV